MNIPFHTVRGTIDLTALEATDVSAEALADTLAKINRFNGRTPQPWSVASHSILVEQLCPHHDLKGWALLHDAHEAFLGDITSPAVELLCVSGTRTAVNHALKNAKGALDRVIGTAWECPPRSASLEIRRADWLALHAETAVFFGTSLDEHVPADREAILRACDLIPELTTHRWQDARDGWILRAAELASMGLLRLPRATAPQF